MMWLKGTNAQVDRQTQLVSSLIHVQGLGQPKNVKRKGNYFLGATIDEKQ